MSATLVRLRALVRKELQAILGDRQSLRLLILPVVLQLLVFPFAATLEVKDNTVAILDEDGGVAAHELVQRLAQLPAFSRVVRVDGEVALRETIDRQEALLALRVPSGFSAGAARGAPPPIQVLVDGRRPSSGQAAVSSVQQVLGRMPLAGRTPPAPPLTVRSWYNPNLESFRFVVPALVAIITTLSVLIVTAMSVAREREQGTLDQLLVSPLTPSLIFLGKAAPALLVAALQASIILVGGVVGYDIPFRGSLPLLYGCLVGYAAALVGVGLLISSVCSTQQQAFLGIFFFLMPAILLSGFVTPVDNMPRWMQLATWANPVRHFFDVTKGVYLKAAVLQDVAPSMVALLAIGVVTSGTALAVFHRRLS